jgi:aconitate hydratase
LGDIWPSNAEILDHVTRGLKPEMFREQYEGVANANPEWNAIEAVTGELYEWNEKSTYIQEPPFFDDFSLHVGSIRPIGEMRLLALLGDSVTTDHISPAGSFAKDSPAGRYLMGEGVEPAEFNSYGSRRGNDRVMKRGTFANVRIKNQMAGGKEGGFTLRRLRGIHAAPDTFDRDCGDRLWHGQFAGLGGQGHQPAWCPGSAGAELRAHSPQQSGWTRCASP